MVQAVSARALDILDPVVQADPYPHYAHMRALAGIPYLTDDEIFVASRFDDVYSILRDHERFSSQLPQGGSLAQIASGRRGMENIPDELAGFEGVSTMMTSDPPMHTRLRRLVSSRFTPKAIRQMEPRIRQICEGMVDDLIDADRESAADLARMLAGPLPVTVIAEMLGIPIERLDDFKRWSDEIVTLVQGTSTPADIVGTFVELFAFFHEQIADRERSPRDDLISMLVADDPEAGRLGQEELSLFCLLLLLAGNETTTNLIANWTLAAFAHPTLPERLAADPNLIPAAVEETLRWDGPAQILVRVATTQAEVAGTTIPAGALVMVITGAANRDPRHFDDPDTFRLDRDPNDHLAFGSGIHLCLGAALARLETQIAIETLLGRVQDLRPTAPPKRLAGLVIRGADSIPITFEPR